VAKRKAKQKQQSPSATIKGEAQSGTSFQAQLKQLLDQKKYRKALDKIKQARRGDPDLQFSPSEATIWSLRGQQEFSQDNFKQAESSFRRALELGLNGEAHYWIAKCYLELNQLDKALDLIRQAFDNNLLSKDYIACYLKLLLLNGDTDTVEDLITHQTQHFSKAQILWARAALALSSGDPAAALPLLKRSKNILTPGHVPNAWLAYTHQQLKDWDAAAANLNLNTAFSFLALKQPILTRLAIFQTIETEISSTFNLQNIGFFSESQLQVANILDMLELIDEGDYHEAAHIFLRLGRNTRAFPELETIRSPLMLLAGQHAFNQDEMNCAIQFWQPLTAEKPFNPQLAVNLHEALYINDADRDDQRLLTRLLNWLEKEAKQQPQDWPAARLNLTLANIHCLIADSGIRLGKERTAFAAVRQAERLCADSPEVLARRGIIAAEWDENYQEAANLLTRALAGGCRFPDAYGQLLDSLETLGDEKRLQDVRQRFGQHFGDLVIEQPDTKMPRWVDALATQDYSLFSQLVSGGSHNNDFPVSACSIFVNNTIGKPNSGGRVSFQQDPATAAWDKLLDGLPAEDQTSVLQAIVVSIQLFAKRAKGIKALMTQYSDRLLALADRDPEAQAAHLAMLAVQQTKPNRLQMPLRRYLDKMPKPGAALAKLQLSARRFSSTPAFVTFIDEALARETQNPLLLLAKATTYPADSPTYKEFHQKGFELARRLQDADALQAFRQEKSFLVARDTQELLPDLDDFMDEDAMDAFLERLIRKMAPGNISQAELDEILPTMKEMFFKKMADSGDFDDFEFEDDADFDSFEFDFRPPKRKRRKGFRDL